MTTVIKVSDDLLVCQPKDKKTAVILKSMVGKCQIVYIALCVLAVVVDGFNETCDRNIFINGCNTPLDIGMNFTQPCDRHDLCYSCGCRYDITRRTCDEKFSRNMLRTCDSLGLISRVICKAQAHAFYYAVRISGAFFWYDVSPPWCNKTWIRPCLL